MHRACHPPLISGGEGTGPESAEPRDADSQEAVDDVLAAAVDAVPEGSPLAQVLKQAGWVGLTLGVLIGNIPLSAAVEATADQKATLNLDAIETYATVLALLTPFVVLAAVITWISLTDNVPQIGGIGAAFAVGILWWVAIQISLALGGLAPAESVAGPTNTSPGGWITYVFASIGDYIALYGPLPVLAGPIEGVAFGYWAWLLAKK